jgi:RNA polymerase sigma factor (sigma-70 family)
VTIFEGNRPLLDAFRGGEREALRKVYVRYVTEVANFLRRGFTLAGPPPARVPGVADDARLGDGTQEVFVRAFGERARQSYDGLRPYRPFLLRIARNLRIDEVRASGRELLASGDDDFEPQADPSEAPPAPEEDVHWQGLSRLAREYIEGLDAEARRYVEARFVEELSQAEVAETMGITRRRVRTLEHDVQAGLKRFLAQRRQR